MSGASSEGTVDANPIKGKYAGSIFFAVGEAMHIRVKGGSYSPFHSFKVLDCCLITRPQVSLLGPEVPTQNSPPSPYVTNEYGIVTGATNSIPLGEFIPSTVVLVEPEYHEIAQEWENHLTVGFDQGRWEFSFVLTVEITRAEGDTIQRVFKFDPECEVSGGISPDVNVLRNIDPLDRVSMMPECEVSGGISPA